MSNLFFLNKYWKKHKRNMAALLLPGVLLCAIVVFFFLRNRENFHTSINEYYNGECGIADVVVCNEVYPEDIIDDITKGKNCIYGYAYATGKTGNNMGEFTCGYLDDPENLCHVSFEKGRLPEKEGEVAIGRKLLDRLCIVSDVGESVILNGNKYILCGIINDKDARFNETNEIDQIYNQFSEEIESGNILVADFPKILFYKNDATVKYSFTMISGIFYSGQGKPQYNKGLVELLQEKADSEAIYNGKNYLHNINRFKISDKAKYSEFVADNRVLKSDNKWFLLITSVASFVAAFSIITVLRIIFEDRKHDLLMLHKIGFSKRKIGTFYLLECSIITIIQLIIGTGLGYLSYETVFLYQKNMLGKGVYSGITDNPYVTYFTHNPILYGILISSAVIIIAYWVNCLISIIEKTQIKRKAKEGMSKAVFFRIFRRPGVTMIQIVSLALICLGISLAYIYYSYDGKEYQNGIMYVFPQYPDYSVGEGLNLKEDKLAEYYGTRSQNISSISTEGNFGLSFAENGFSRGIDDETAGKLGNAMSIGKLENTLFVTDEKSDNLVYELGEFSDGTKNLILDNSSERFSEFFDKGIGSKHLYRVTTKLADKKTIKSMEDYIVEGSIDYDALDAGMEVIVVAQMELYAEKFKVGEKYTVASILANTSGFGIEEVNECEVTVSAVILLPEKPDKLCQYVASVKGQSYVILTTASGAEKMGLHNAKYTEVISKDDIDGGLIPPVAHMSGKSYKKIKRDIRIKKLVDLSGIIGISAIMIILGFAAYFNAIGMKIRSRAYEISILRTLGISMRKIKMWLVASSLKIPLISCLLAAFITRRIQLWSKHAYKVFLTMDETRLPYEQQEAFVQKAVKYESDHFLDRVIWMVPIVKIFVIIFIVLTVLTWIFTLLGLRKLQGNIAEKVSEGRRRE